MIISDNGISKVWREGDFAFKQQPKFLTDNEIYCLHIMYPCVPFAEQVSIDTIKLQWIGETEITDFDLLSFNFLEILRVLDDADLRHGDLTKPNILIRDNKPFVIDWSESRLACDPRPDKRREGDEYWLKRTLNELQQTLP
jgi:tRNA A-37 threonylcarbamoyl transferase component Bud32